MDAHTEEILEFGRIRSAIAAETTCALGSERAARRPIATTGDDVQREYAMIDDLYKLFDGDHEPPIAGLKDLRKVWLRLTPHNAVLEGAELLEVANFCAVIARVRKFFTQHRNGAPALSEQVELLALLHDVEFHIRHAIEPSGEVSDDASPRLKELRGEIRSFEARIQHTLERLVRTLDDEYILQDDFITQRQGRYVLPVITGQKGKVRGIIHDASHSGETLFIEPFAVVEATNDLTERRVEAREEVRRILAGLCDMVRDELPALEQNTALLADLDERVARARFGWSRGWILPRWSAKRPFHLAVAHHPLLLLQSPETSVPLDLPLGADDRALIVSGPNAGGKTTALKTVGLLTLMFQSAMPVPADPASNFRVFQRVLADIGDEQDVTAGVSTFSSHIRNIARMLNVADEATLVLLDELGTATDPGEGGALAVAIVESLIEKGSLALVTSHLALLKSWAEPHDRARNASYHLDPKTQHPTYRMRLDVPGVSEALVIAEQQGLDRRVIERAYSLLPEGVHDLNQVLLRIEKREQELAAELERAAGREQAAGTLQAQLEREREQLQEQRRHLKRDFMREKEVWLRDVRQQVETQIAQLASREEILDAKRRIQAMQDEVREEQRTLDRDVPFAPSALERLTPGRRVRVEMLHDEGEIVSVDRERQRVMVAVRNVEVELTPDQVAVLEEEPAAERNKSVWVPAGDFVGSEIELHGLRVEEALERVDRHIDLALRNDVSPVRLRHGRGTGALRRAIHEYLREHKSVRAFALAEQDEGGDGVTVVELK